MSLTSDVEVKNSKANYEVHSKGQQETLAYYAGNAFAYGGRGYLLINIHETTKKDVVYGDDDDNVY